MKNFDYNKMLEARKKSFNELLLETVKGDEFEKFITIVKKGGSIDDITVSFRNLALGIYMRGIEHRTSEIDDFIYGKNGGESEN